MSYPALIADIGGTNVRFCLVDADGRNHSTLILQCADYPHINDAIAHYLATVKPATAPTRAAFAVAAPPDDTFVRFTNQAWAFATRDVCERFGFSELKIINDFTAVALSLPLLGDAHKVQIGGDKPRPGAPVSVLGPGTGLGVSTIVPANDPKYIILTNTEGGHFTIPPMTDRESDVLAVLRQHYNHVSAERVLSGPGLVNLYEALCELDQAPKEKYGPADIARHGLKGDCPLCHEALDMFCAFLGTAASNICITVAAYGGIYLAGGILPKLGDYFAASKFRKRFETKGRFSNYLEPVPVYLISHDLPAMLGLTALVLEQE